MVLFTKKNQMNYENLIHVVSTLVNDEHIFYTVIEEIFTESMLSWQKTKDIAQQLRIIKLTEIITSICILISQDYFNRTHHKNTIVEFFRNFH